MQCKKAYGLNGFHKLRIVNPNTYILYRDNKTSIIFIKNAKSQSWTKYINV